MITRYKHDHGGSQQQPRPPDPSDGRFSPGAVFAERYRISHLLGRGGMGVVYRADDLVLGQPVALKFLPRGLQPYYENQLLHEVRLARQISHPNVCKVYDVGKAEGLRFLSMEYIEGEDLEVLLRRVGRLPRERVVALGRDLCSGLAAAHGRGILHRDLKPSNLMVDNDGHVHIMDFGIAGLSGAADGSNPRRGTPAYMAPEQRAGQEASVRSDLYSLGLVLYELLTGVKAAQRRPLEPPARWTGGLSARIERIVMRCLADAPAERPSSVEEVAAALGDGASPAWSPAAEQAIPRRHPWVLLRQLGKGGFGDVWLAVHQELGEHRVFKFCQDSSRLEFLKREITLFRLLHSELGQRGDIVRILDWNFDEAPYFIESEFVQGGSLLEWAQKKQDGIANVSLVARLEIVAQVAVALAAAHSVGVLHKDVKPGNVLLDGEAEEPRARLADFGTGRLLEPARLADAGITLMGLTQTTATSSSGTLLYQAPELLEGKAPTLQADIYSLGVMLYQLVVGDLGRVLGPGWEHDVTDELLREDIAAVVDRDPRRRLADAGAFAVRLRSLEARRVERDAEYKARQEAVRYRLDLERASRRRRVLTVALGVTLAVTALVLLLAGRIAWQARHIDQEAARQRNITRVSVAGEWLNRDPTRAALVLLEVDAPDEVPYAVSRMRQALQHKLALFELHHDDIVLSAAWSPSGESFFTASEKDGLIRLSPRGGRGQPLELEGCGGILTSAAWSPDGDGLAATCHDGTVRVFPAHDSPPKVFEGHDSPVMTAAWSPDGGRLATASQDGQVRIWTRGTAVDADWTAGPVSGHQQGVTAASWSPDGRLLATASYDGTARVWQVAENAALSALRVLEHTAGRRVWSALWSPDGERVLTASNDGTARIWKIRGSTEPIVLAGHREAVRVAVWSPDGQWVLTASQDRTARVWSSTGALLSVLVGHQGGLRTAAWSPDGQWILTSADDGAARVWRFSPQGPEGGDLAATFAGHDAWLRVAKWSPDGERILTVSGPTARVWRAGTSLADRGSGEPRLLSGHQDSVRKALWSPDGRRIATTSRDRTTRIWYVGPDGLDESPQLLIPATGVRTVDWSPDGKQVVTAFEDGTAQVWPVHGSGPSVVLEGAGGSLVTAAFDPAGERIVTASEDGAARVWRADGQGEPTVLRGAEAPLRIAAWSPDGEWLLTASSVTVWVWRLESGTSEVSEPLVLSGHEGLLRTAVWAPQSRRLVTSSDDGTARVWQVGWSDEGRPVRTSEVVLDHGPTTPVWAAAFSPSGDRIVTGLQEGEIQVWRAAGGGQGALLQGHRFAVTSVAFSPDGEWVLSTSVDDTAQVQRADGGGEPIVLEGHGDWVWMAMWSPRGDRIVTASRDGTARVWRFGTKDLTTLLKAATAICLDPEFRQKKLGEAPDGAWRRYALCERSHGRLVSTRRQPS